MCLNGRSVHQQRLDMKLRASNCGEIVQSPGIDIAPPVTELGAAQATLLVFTSRTRRLRTPQPFPAGLLKHPLERCVTAARLIGGRVLVVNAVDPDAADLWRRRGFLPSKGRSFGAVSIDNRTSRHLLKKAAR
jgi:hypothetical protein